MPTQLARTGIRAKIPRLEQASSDPQVYYHDLGPDFYNNRIGPERRRCNHVRQLGALGYKVTLEPDA